MHAVADVIMTTGHPLAQEQKVPVIHFDWLSAVSVLLADRYGADTLAFGGFSCFLASHFLSICSAETSLVAILTNLTLVHPHLQQYLEDASK